MAELLIWQVPDCSQAVFCFTKHILFCVFFYCYEKETFICGQYKFSFVNRWDYLINKYFAILEYGIRRFELPRCQFQHFYLAAQVTRLIIDA